MNSARRNTIRLCAVGLCVALAGCGGRTTSAPVGGSTSNKAEKSRNDAEALAFAGISGGATAYARADPEATVPVRHDPGFNITLGTPPAIPTRPDSIPATPLPTMPAFPPTRPQPQPAPVGPPGPHGTARPGWVIRERVVSSIPYPTEAEAEEDVLALARDLVEKRLATLDPPLKHKPTLGEVRTEFLRHDTRVVRQADAAQKEALAQNGSDFVYVEYDLEVTAEQVRELRSQDRVYTGLRVTGVLVAIALAGFLFLRADEWTKGYLTRWLALGAATAGGGVAAALIFL